MKMFHVGLNLVRDTSTTSDNLLFPFLRPYPMENAGNFPVAFWSARSFKA